MRAKRLFGALAVGALGAGVTALTLFANQRLSGPALPETGQSLALTSLLASLPLWPLLALMAAFSGPWPFRALAAAMSALGWYWAGERLAASFGPALGQAWLPGEPFTALVWHPPLTALLWGATVALYLALLSRFNRA